MPATILHPLIKISTDFTSEPIVLRDVTAKSIGRFYFTTGTYRDLPRITFGKVAASMGTGLVPAITDLPVVGDDKAPQNTSAATFSRTRMVGPDDALHIPPRSLDHWETCYFFAYNGATIPPPPTVQLPNTVTFTAAVGGLCTALGNTYNTGDTLVLVTTNALPAPLSLAAVYTFVKVTSNTFRLLDPNGNPVNLTNTGTGTHQLVLVKQATPPAMQNVDDIDVIPFLWNPQISYPSVE